MILRVAQFLFVILLQTGCVATGPVFQKASDPEKDYALVYLYRPSSPFAIFAKPSIQIDESQVIELPNKGYTKMYLPAGEHRFKVEWSLFTKPSGASNIGKTFDFSPGSTNYVRFVFSSGGVVQTGNDATSLLGRITNTLTHVPNDVGSKEISVCKLIDGN